MDDNERGEAMHRVREMWRAVCEWIPIVGMLVLSALILAMMFAPKAQAATVNLAWKASPASDLAGYKIYRADTACAKATATAWRPVKTVQGNTTFASDVVGKGIYCYRMTAYDIAGNESSPSGTQQVRILTEEDPWGFVVHSVAP